VVRMGDGSGSTGEGRGTENFGARAWNVGSTNNSGLDWFGLSLQWMTDDIRFYKMVKMVGMSGSLE
jgi:hypothetical protein